MSGCLGVSDSGTGGDETRTDAAASSEGGTGTDCDAESDGGNDEPGLDPKWNHGVGGRVHAVADGRVIGSEDFAAEGADGGVSALDAETGDHEWTYGETHGYSSDTVPTVADAVYFGLGDNAIGSGSGETYALEFDGEERWTRDTGSVYASPRVVDDPVYVGGDDGVVRAFDAADGAER